MQNLFEFSVNDFFLPTIFGVVNNDLSLLVMMKIVGRKSLKIVGRNIKKIVGTNFEIVGRLIPLLTTKNRC